MEDFSAKISILTKLAGEKGEMLKTVLTLTENQETILQITEDTQETKDFFYQLSDEKQKYIDMILEKDQLFDKVFTSIDHIFEEEAQNHKELIRALQDNVRVASEFDIKIRAVEQNNKTLVVQKYINKKKLNQSMKAPKKEVLDRYRQNTRDPQ